MNTSSTVHRQFENDDNEGGPTPCFQDSSRKGGKVYRKTKILLTLLLRFRHCLTGGYRHRERRFPETSKQRQLEKQLKTDSKTGSSTSESIEHINILYLAMHIATHALAHARPTMPCIHLIQALTCSYPLCFIALKSSGAIPMTSRSMYVTSIVSEVGIPLTARALERYI